MAGDLRDLIDDWRRGLEGEPLPLDREEAISDRLSELTALVLACGFTEAEQNDALNEDARVWIGKEYDHRKAFPNKLG